MSALRVLLVDDTEADRYIAARILRKVWPDVEIIEAADGEEAIEALERCGRDVMPDVVLLDVNMPRMNGHAFLEAWYVEEGVDIPVVMMLTSSSQTCDRDRAERFGCVRGYVIKPIDRPAVARLSEMLVA